MSIIDYIFEFKNYKFLQYLFQENIIWLVDNSGWDGMTYGAGTKIKRGELGYIGGTSMPAQIKYQDQIRTQAVALAIENMDVDMLDKLCARENPGLHSLPSLLCGFDSRKYYNEDMVHAIADSNETMLDYFSQEFIVKDSQKRSNQFIFPYIGEVIDIMLEKNRGGVELLIRRALDHNKKAYEKLVKMAKTLYDFKCEPSIKESDDDLKASLRKEALHYYSLSERKDMVWCNFNIGRKEWELFTSNIVKITKKSSSALLNELIEESNEWYKKIVSTKGEPNE